MGKQVKINFPMTNDIKIPATIQLIRHKNKSESVILCTTLDDGKPIKLEAKLMPDKNKKDWWNLSCCGWETGSDTKNRHISVAYLFRTSIDVFNSFIEANKYVEVRVRIPKGKYCDILDGHGCPMYNDGSGEYSLHCQFLPEHPEIFYDYSGGCELPLKHKDCPALNEQC